MKNFNDWAAIKPSIGMYASSEQRILICPVQQMLVILGMTYLTALRLMS
jgi:hypothetical protein